MAASLSPPPFSCSIARRSHLGVLSNARPPQVRVLGGTREAGELPYSCPMRAQPSLPSPFLLLLVLESDGSPLVGVVGLATSVSLAHPSTTRCRSFTPLFCSLALCHLLVCLCGLTVWFQQEQACSTNFHSFRMFWAAPVFVAGDPSLADIYLADPRLAPLDVATDCGPIDFCGDNPSCAFISPPNPIKIKQEPDSNAATPSLEPSGPIEATRAEPKLDPDAPPPTPRRATSRISNRKPPASKRKPPASQRKPRISKRKPPATKSPMTKVSELVDRTRWGERAPPMPTCLPFTLPTIRPSLLRLLRAPCPQERTVHERHEAFLAEAERILRACSGVNPHMRKDQPARSSGRTTADYHFRESLLYACALYPRKYPSWLMRVGWLMERKKGANNRLPSDSQLSRHKTAYKKQHPEYFGTT